MKEVDKDNSGVIEIDEFIEFMRRHIVIFLSYTVGQQ